MNATSRSRLATAIELVGLAIFIAVYLVAFRAVVPSGDGLVYVRAIKDGSVVWNPNHLLMEPIAALWHRLLSHAGATQSPLTSLRVLAGISTVATVLLFCATLRYAARVARPWRVLACFGLFFSANFLSLAGCEEFFMIQMPWLIVALWIGVTRFEGETASPDQPIWAGLLGMVVAVTTLIQVNNAFLAVSLALFLATRPYDSLRARLANVLVMIGSGIVVGVPVVLLGHRLSGSSSTLVSWLISYQGASGGGAGRLYGIEPTLVSVLESVSRLAYNVLANFADPAGVGTIAKSVVFGQPMEWRPEILKVSTGITLLVITFVLLLFLIIRWLRHRTVAVVGSRLGVFWLVAYAAFNILWNDSSNQFYVQLLPVFWLWLAGSPAIESRSGVHRMRMALCVFVPLLAIFNTLYVVAPNALIDQDGLEAQHLALFADGDLEIVPGWDHIRWLSVDSAGHRVDQLSLMTMALRPQGDELRIERLPEIVRSYLERDRHVFVARLFDKDGVVRPWDQLRKTGWSRRRIQELLSEFDVGKPVSIGEVSIRSVRKRQDPYREPAPGSTSPDSSKPEAE